MRKVGLKVLSSRELDHFSGIPAHGSVRVRATMFGFLSFLRMSLITSGFITDTMRPMASTAFKQRSWFFLIQNLLRKGSAFPARYDTTMTTHRNTSMATRHSISFSSTQTVWNRANSLGASWDHRYNKRPSVPDAFLHIVSSLSTQPLPRILCASVAKCGAAWTNSVAGFNDSSPIASCAPVPQ